MIRSTLARTAKQDRLPDVMRPPTHEHEGSTSSFLSHNLRTITELTYGRLKKAPWWLRGKYSHVVTYDELSSLR